MQVQLDHLGKRLGVIALTLVGLLSFLQFLRGAGLVHIVLDAIALSVAAMPEGLPVVVTVTLALGMHKMARQHAIVKRLASVETLGCTTVICSDKTGTLTLNQMTARAFVCEGKHFDVSGEGYLAAGCDYDGGGHVGDVDLAPLLVPMVACNDSRVDDGKVIGDPMEAALLVLAAKGGSFGTRSRAACRAWPNCRLIRHTSSWPPSTATGTRCRSSSRGHLTCCCQGVALARGRCRTATLRVGQKANRRGLSIPRRTRAARAAGRIAHGACERIRCEPVTLPAWVGELCFVGLIGLMDPPRAGGQAGHFRLRTGGNCCQDDHGRSPDDRLGDRRELGLQGRAVSGADLDRMDAAQLAAAIDEIAVFARVTPAHKVKIVRALQARGHVVAMTGDGVNDAPALKQADIGVAMGIGGTAVAKEAATMVLTDDNFATIVTAVRLGRTLYDNILKFVRFQLSTTIGAILTVFFAPLAGLPEPFTALQILWVAIIMDGPPAVSLALDTARPGIMNEPPRQRIEPVLTFGARDANPCLRRHDDGGDARSSVLRVAHWQ